jgi:exodeoxyribonuclease V alpha subunit
VTVTTARQLFERGVLSALDFELAETLLELAGERSELCALGVAFASWAVSRGHVCVELASLGERRFEDADGELITDVVLPEVDAWVAALEASALTREGPLVLAPGGRLYLARYHDYERELGRALLERSRVIHDDLDPKRVKQRLDELFPKSDDQRRAGVVAALRGLSVISGGPGTGKTYTVAKVLALLKAERDLRVTLLAPTGKAAQRLTETIQRDFPDLSAATIHRALGYQRHTPTKFRHGRDNPLPADVVIVDEASMVDLALMAKLVEAVRPGARLILLGDKDQLASVEAGAILGDIYSGNPDDGYSEEMAAAAAKLTGEVLPVSLARPEPGMHDAMVHLTEVHRFAGGGAIAALARAVNAGDPSAAFDALAQGPDATLVELAPDADLDAALGPLALDRFRGLGNASTEEKLRLLSGFRFLCAHREGPLGVHGLNERVAALLTEAGELDARGEWYDGRPLLVTANDYALDLFNGDVGVIHQGRAFFHSGSGIRELPPGQLPAHETVFAMSVHKSQGSELDEVALILPERVSPILTRELVYTAITRAKKRVKIFGSREVLARAIEARVQRASGLSAMLWQRH